ncbi:hemerythrin domain-containing protein [Streptomyces sp. NPDC049837]|uniref:hemerythrin domain-containing protein n=1 Tax=Streptomyces sp. NPDC049837 TaxID=3155277 RepID=UPI003426DEF6
MPRVDLYRYVHMGQRERLFALAIEVGAADTAQRDTVVSLTERCLAMTRELREHADHEDRHIHPLLRERAPEAADALDAEHIRLDAALAALDDRARRLPKAPDEELPDAQHALYLALNELISAYLAHLHAEETVAMPALWQTSSDAELGAVFAAFKASRTPEESLSDLRKMLPSLPPAIRAAIVRATLTTVPDDETGRTLAALTTTLDPGRRGRLYEDLGVPEAWALKPMENGRDR